MRYFYNQKDAETVTYYTHKDMEKIRIYPATEKLMKEYDTNSDTNLCPICGFGQFSWEFGEFKNIEAAREELRDWLNVGIYEAEHDL